MATSRSSVSIEASPEVVFAFLSDTSNLPRFVPGLVEAAPQSEGRVRVTVQTDGEPITLEATVRLKEGHSPRIEWGTEGPHGYRGWVEVDREGSVASVTAELHTKRVDSARVDAALDSTLWALKQEIEAANQVEEGSSS